MTKYKILFLISIFFGQITSCADEPEDEATLGNWTRTTPFKGRPRAGAIVFTVGTQAFVGLGYDGDDYLSDFYVMDLTSGYWEAKANFPGLARERAIAFSINGKGYVGLGYNRDEDDEELGDFWEYDPALNAWRQLTSFGGTARYNAIGFSIASKGYIGTGYDGDEYNSDFWEYDPQSDAWREIKSYPGEKIEGGLAIVIGGKAFICGGRNNGLFNTNLWEFDPSGSEVLWTNRSPDDDESYYDDFKAAVSRYDAVTFTVQEKGYVMGGVSSAGATNGSVYEFDPATGIWDERTSFEGSPRSLAVAYVLDSRAFVATGQNASSRYDDVWEFKPDEEYDSSY